MRLIRRCWPEWVNKGVIQRQEGSGRPRGTTERKNRVIVRTNCRSTGFDVNYHPTYDLHRNWCRKRSTWNCADWGRIVFSDDSRFLMCPDDRRKRVWRRPVQRVDSALTYEHHTGPQQGVMVWSAISFNSRAPLAVISGTLTARGRILMLSQPVKQAICKFNQDFVSSFKFMLAQRAIT
ncbi:hypothetical protein LAZ67_X001457 [Cordylochernes scorpioides]|uniref:Transposase n=1 Tax=Cordylochernes scorpioides TaxID=51811 RepID=A0ABY6LV41_9ARAC|nr:hypothetical protein LAZ67_X001457 [Cordylochernes scorpioides]